MCPKQERKSLSFYTEAELMQKLIKDQIKMTETDAFGLQAFKTGFH